MQMTIIRFVQIAILLVIGLSLPAPAVAEQQSWQLTSVSGHLPDLEFDLTNDAGQRLTQNDLRGSVILLYFGYTSCNSECPVTLARLDGVLRRMPSTVRIKVLFVTIDPAHDTPRALHGFLSSFAETHFIGLTGDIPAIEAIARRYRTVFRRRERGDTGMDIPHSDTIYLFDKSSRARLLAMISDSDTALIHDVNQLLSEP